MADKKIAFFIDDDSDFLEALQDVVSHPHFEIQTYLAQNGYKAIDETIKQKPDVLFVDFNLPRASGAQIIPILKSVKAFDNVPVYFLTGHSRDEVEPLLEHVKYDGIIQKSDTLPRDIVQILDKIQPAG